MHTQAVFRLQQQQRGRAGEDIAGDLDGLHGAGAQQDACLGVGMGQQGIIHLPLLRQLVIQSRAATGINEVAAFHGLLGRTQSIRTLSRFFRKEKHFIWNLNVKIAKKRPKTHDFVDNYREKVS